MKKIAISLFGLIFASLPFFAVHASEITGTLTAGSAQEQSQSSGSGNNLSGTVVSPSSGSPGSSGGSASTGGSGFSSGGGSASESATPDSQTVVTPSAPASGGSQSIFPLTLGTSDDNSSAVGNGGASALTPSAPFAGGNDLGAAAASSDTTTKVLALLTGIALLGIAGYALTYFLSPRNQ